MYTVICRRSTCMLNCWVNQGSRVMLCFVIVPTENNTYWSIVSVPFNFSPKENDVSACLLTESRFYRNHICGMLDNKRKITIKSDLWLQLSLTSHHMPVYCLFVFSKRGSRKPVKWVAVLVDRVRSCWSAWVSFGRPLLRRNCGLLHLHHYVSQ